MKVENLESIWRQEKRDEEFASLPFHYLEISSLLLSVAPDDMGPDCDRMRTLLEDIENVRQGKMYKGMGDAAMRLDGAIKVSATTSTKIQRHLSIDMWMIVVRSSA
jgi:GINS complex protein